MKLSNIKKHLKEFKAQDLCLFYVGFLTGAVLVLLVV